MSGGISNQEAIGRYTNMDLRFTAEDEAFRTEVRGWLEANIPEQKPRTMEEKKSWHQRLYQAGFVGMGWPKEYGGRNARPMEQAIVGEEMVRSNAPPHINYLGVAIVGPTLIHHGTEEQKQRYVHNILNADELWCQLYSEPNSGSDLASLQCRADIDGDEFVINGQKIWTSFGEVADYCYLICRTSTDGPAHEGISEIVVPMDTPGIEVRPITDMTTNRHFCEVWYTDVRVPVTNLVGVEGGAFKQTMRQLEHERGGIDRLVSNHALYKMAVDRADTSDPIIRQQIAALEIGYRVGRILVTREVLGQAPKGFSAATKCFCTEHEWRVAEFVAAIFGAAVTTWSDVTRGLLYAPGYTIMGGTSNIMRNILAERVLGLPREPR
jgi:alkylation response protein AidB-like acyl-CoA dehydrogenase